MPVHEGRMLEMVFCPDGRHIFSAEDAGQVDVVDVVRRAQMGNILVGRPQRAQGDQGRRVSQ